MRLFKYFLPSLLLLGCQSTVIQNEEGTLSDIEETLQHFATYDLDLGSAGSVLLTGDWLDDKQEYNDYTKYVIRLTKHKAYYTAEKLAERCMLMGGIVYQHNKSQDNYTQSCEDSSERDKLLFHSVHTYQQLKKADWAGYVLIYYDMNESGSQKLTEYDTYSYREAQKRKEIERRERREFAKKRQLEQELAELENLVQTTRKQVMTRGTRICRAILGESIVGFTDDATDTKIKVLMDNQYFWDYPNRWYACE